MAKKEEATGLKKFATENKSLLFTIPVFVVLLVIVLFVYVFSGNNDNTTEVVSPTPSPVATASQEPTESQPVETTSPEDQGTIVIPLPDTERDKDSDEIYRNPFAVPYKVSGIIYSSKGDSVAIIEAENKSFIVKVGDNAEDYFTVLNIEENSVTLKVEGYELILLLLDN